MHENWPSDKWRQQACFYRPSKEPRWSPRQHTTYHQPGYQDRKLGPKLLFLPIRGRAVDTRKSPREVGIPFAQFDGEGEKTRFNGLDVKQIRFPAYNHTINWPLCRGEHPVFIATTPERRHNLSILCFLDSCIITMSALKFLRISLIDEFFFGQPRPLTFHEIIFIKENKITQAPTTAGADYSKSAASLLTGNTSSKITPESLACKPTCKVSFFYNRTAV